MLKEKSIIMKFMNGKEKENFYHNKSFCVAFYRCEAVNWNIFKNYKSYWVFYKLKLLLSKIKILGFDNLKLQF